ANRRGGSAQATGAPPPRQRLDARVRHTLANRNRIEIELARLVCRRNLAEGSHECLPKVNAMPTHQPWWHWSGGPGAATPSILTAAASRHTAPAPPRAGPQPSALYRQCAPPP